MKINFTNSTKCEESQAGTLTKRVSGLKIESEFKGLYNERESRKVKEISVIESLDTLIGHES